jgi:hypothetical protein
MNTYVVNRYNVPTLGATSQLKTLLTTDATVHQFGVFQKNTKVIFISVKGGGVFMTIDGSEPTNVNNHKLYAGSDYYFNADLVSKAKFKRDNNNANTAYVYGSELTN